MYVFVFYNNVILGATDSILEKANASLDKQICLCCVTATNEERELQSEGELSKKMKQLEDRKKSRESLKQNVRV